MHWHLPATVTVTFARVLASVAADDVVFAGGVDRFPGDFACETFGVAAASDIAGYSTKGRCGIERDDVLGALAGHIERHGLLVLGQQRCDARVDKCLLKTASEQVPTNSGNRVPFGAPFCDQRCDHCRIIDKSLLASNAHRLPDDVVWYAAFRQLASESLFGLRSPCGRAPQERQSLAHVRIARNRGGLVVQVLRIVYFPWPLWQQRLTLDALLREPRFGVAGHGSPFLDVVDISGVVNQDGINIQVFFDLLFDL